MRKAVGLEIVFVLDERAVDEPTPPHGAGINPNCCSGSVLGMRSILNAYRSVHQPRSVLSEHANEVHEYSAIAQSR
jgi:hypothetical protein